MARPTGPRRSVAVVGSGIAGLTAAHLLRRRFDVAVYEADDRFGGHAHTHTFGADRVDSGFRMFHERSSPLLRRLFDQLDLTCSPIEMSIGVRCDGCGLEYADGRGPEGLHAQRRRALDRRFSRLVEEIPRYRALALDLAKSLDPASAQPTLAQFLERNGFGAHFVRHHALPVACGVWSAAAGSPLAEPAKHVFTVMRRLGLLSPDPHRHWHGLDGGARSYVDAITALLRESFVRSPVTAITRTPDRIELSTTRRTEFVDHVVLATHADDALRLLTDPTPDESAVLGAFAYARRSVTVHRDPSVLPRTPRAWATWNLRLDDCGDGPVTVSSLTRPRPEAPPYVVTLAPPGAPATHPSTLALIEYRHPVLSRTAVAARRRLPLLNDERTTFAGAYHGWGLHEDGCRAGVAAAAHLGSGW